MVWTEESESEREEDKNEKTENAIEKPVNEIENEVQETESEREQTENDEEEIEKESDNEVIEKEDVGEMEDGFSFHRYNGPVSGKVRKVVVPNTNPQRQGSTSVDYVVRIVFHIKFIDINIGGFNTWCYNYYNIACSLFFTSSVVLRLLTV